MNDGPVSVSGARNKLPAIDCTLGALSGVKP